MMDWSDHHCRAFWRLMTRKSRLYSEMVTAKALIHGDSRRFLAKAPLDSPVALQLGGSDPRELALCARMAEDAGFDEVNLNCGCPSDRVQEGRIGACLMAEPALVADCIAAMMSAVSIPVTIKHRIGIDHLDTDEHLDSFVTEVKSAGCRVFIVHARKAWLKGLSPKENREIPPLEYARVLAIKQRHPELTWVLNGGLSSLDQVETWLQPVDQPQSPLFQGAMLGREIYHNPYWLAQVDQHIFGDKHPIITREEVFAEFLRYASDVTGKGTHLHHLTRHILGLYAHQPGGRYFRRYITEHSREADGLARLYTLLEEIRARSPA